MHFKFSVRICQYSPFLGISLPFINTGPTPLVVACLDSHTNLSTMLPNLNRGGLNTVGNIT